MRPFNVVLITIIITTGLSTPLTAENVFKWTDSRGVVHYGEEAPKNQRSQSLEMPQITVIEDYGKQWLPLESNKPKKSRKATSSNVPVQKVAAAGHTQSYESLKFLAPRAGQVIEAKDGDISAMMSLKPPLKKGHKLVFSIDGKAKPKVSSRISNFKNLSAGKHTVSVLIVDANGKVQMNSDSLSFQVKR